MGEGKGEGMGEGRGEGDAGMSGFNAGLFKFEANFCWFVSVRS